MRRFLCCFFASITIWSAFIWRFITSFINDEIESTLIWTPAAASNSTIAVPLPVLVQPKRIAIHRDDSCRHFSVFLIGINKSSMQKRYAPALQRIPCFFLVQAFLQVDVEQNIYNFAAKSGIVDGRLYKSKLRLGLQKGNQNMDSMLGLSSRSVQDHFTIACALSHRRVHQLALTRSVQTALVLEMDASIDGRDITQSLEDGIVASRIVANETKKWELINLGRCWDFCPMDQTIRTNFFLHGAWRRLVQSPSPLCSHAYLVTLLGAKKLLSLSMPHVFSIDEALALFGRTRAVNVMAMTPRLWVQKEIESHHDPHFKPECNPSWKKHYAKYYNDAQGYWRKDLEALAVGHDHWVRFADGPAAYECGVSELVTTSTCPVNAIRQRCDFRGGFSKQKFNDSEHGGRFDDERSLLSALRLLGLQGFVVWDLWDAHAHTHHNIHKGIFDAFLDVANQSPKRMHVCWLRAKEWESTCSLERIIYGKEKASFSSDLARSLVVASPKHMGFSHDDPALRKLPVDPFSRYVFHDSIPPRFAYPWNRKGAAVSWVARGPDGNTPLFDATQYGRDNEKSDRGPPFSCPVERLTCAFSDSETYVAPWASPIPPSKIIEYRRRMEAREISRSTAAATTTTKATAGATAAVHFIGTIWPVNACSLAKFAAGCHKAGQRLVHHGNNFLQKNFWESPIGQQCRGRHNVSFGLLRRKQSSSPLYSSSNRGRRSHIPDYARDALLKKSIFGAAVQGEAHLAGLNSYLSDRVLLLASFGHVIATNNPIVQHVLQDSDRDLIAYSPNIGSLCARASAKAMKVTTLRRLELMKIIIEHHTYVSRFADIAQLLVELDAAALESPHPGMHKPEGQSSAQMPTAVMKQPPSWCTELPDIGALRLTRDEIATAIAGVYYDWDSENSATRQLS